MMDGDGSLTMGEGDFEKRRGGKDDLGEKNSNDTSSAPEFPFSFTLKDRELQSTQRSLGPLGREEKAEMSSAMVQGVARTSRTGINSVQTQERALQEPQAQSALLIQNQQDWDGSNEPQLSPPTLRIEGSSLASHRHVQKNYQVQFSPRQGKLQSKRSRNIGDMKSAELQVGSHFLFSTQQFKTAPKLSVRHQ